jgi:hypothetical protein
MFPSSTYRLAYLLHKKWKDRENEDGNSCCDSFGEGEGIRAIPVNIKNEFP